MMLNLSEHPNVDVGAIFDFEEFRLDTRRRELTVPADNRLVPLSSREYDTLLFFVSHAGQTIDKDTLLTNVWHGLVVEENNLHQQITALRQRLGEVRGARRFIVNVRGRGYRFVPHVVQTPSTRGAHPRTALPTRSNEAWQCFQQAMLLIGLDDPAQWRAAVDLLSHAVVLDPTFSGALAFLAQCQLRLMASDLPISLDAVEQAERSARRALTLRPDLGVAQMAAGSVAAARGDWVEAESRFRQAASLDEDRILVGMFTALTCSSLRGMCAGRFHSRAPRNSEATE